MSFSNNKAISTLEYALETSDFGDEEIKAAADLMLFSPDEWDSIKGKFNKDFIVKASAIMKKIKTEHKKSVTEMGIADSFLNQNRGNVRFCDDFQNGWMIFDNRQWDEDNTEKIKSKIRDHIKKIGNGDAKLEKSSVLGAVEKLVKIEQKIRTVADDWDKSAFLMGSPKGVIDLKTGEFKDSHKELLISKRSTVNPCDKIECPKWLQFLDDITDNDEDYKKYLQKMMGYFLTGSTIEQAIFFGFGAGGNGKSIFASMIDLLLGDYFGAAPFSTFAASAVDAHPTDLAGFVGKRCIVASETRENRSWNTDLVKSLSGNDKISARFMRGDFFQYSPSFKLMVLGNHMPNLSSVDHSIRRRFHILPFLFDPVKNKERVNLHLLDDLKKELPAIMQWAVNGCLLWQSEGLEKPDKVKEMTESYFSGEDVFGDFLKHVQENANFKDGKKLRSSALFSIYKEYLDLNGEEPSSNKKMSQQLVKVGIEKKIESKGAFFIWKEIK
tara:strand:+ start:1700 stop:3190 length:1491 start_codon:yes stop_codon:yes gene_type:complete